MYEIIKLAELWNLKFGKDSINTAFTSALLKIDRVPETHRIHFVGTIENFKVPIFFCHLSSLISSTLSSLE